MYGIIFESDLSYMNHIKEIGGNNIFFLRIRKVEKLFEEEMIFHLFLVTVILLLFEEASSL